MASAVEPIIQSTGEESYAYKAEINKLLSILIHSLYTNDEVFLRELLSNASDACDKRRYECLRAGETYNSVAELKIEIIPDKNDKTLTIRDYGVGMTKNDLINNLGRIAESGTLNFLRSNEGSIDADGLIGRFGVGFYSAFLVANSVEVITKHADDVQYRWSSSADGVYTIREDDSEPLQIGTKIVLHLKEEKLSYLEERTLKDKFNKHSHFIPYPVHLFVEKTREVEVEDEEEGKSATTDDAEKLEGESGEPEVVDVMEDESKPKKKKVKETYTEMEQITKVKPIWTKRPDQVSHEEYAQLYKHISNDWEDHLAVKHFAVEGNMQFTSIVYIPRRTPFDLFDKNKKKACPLKLYVNHVFITDDLPDLVPEYLFFIRGIVDSPDLPLNVSRQCLQEAKIVKMMRKSIVKKCLDLITEIQQSEADFKVFYENFSRSLKLGVHEDSVNRQKLAGFLAFPSSVTGPDSMVSFGDYIKRMKDNQKDIYVITGESYAAVHGSPFVEAARKRGFEVLYFVEPIDEYLLNQLKEFDGKQLVCLTKEGVEFPITDEEKKEREEKEKEFESFRTFVSEVLGKKVEKVSLSWRMVDSPFCVVTSQYGWSANMERIMKAQALRDSNQMGYMVGKKNLEINIESPVIQELHKRNKSEPNSVTVRDCINLLFETSLFSAGFPLEDPHQFSNRIRRMLHLGLGIEPTTSIPDSTIVEQEASAAKNSDDDLGSDSDMERMEEVD